ncbi:MAG: hypothetical protein K8H87_01750 [Pseudorhodoplanes sp.]|nr:hypothetical protein [Pseudorhodoplanes sp.]MBZ0138481.1 hypothetical protein [Pseudorhodoplanes sp.]MCL4713191.1 hypothetical protein [Pseudorhodoplanes sp.]
MTVLYIIVAFGLGFLSGWGWMRFSPAQRAAIERKAQELARQVANKLGGKL